MLSSLGSTNAETAKTHLYQRAPIYLPLTVDPAIRQGCFHPMYEQQKQVGGKKINTKTPSAVTQGYGLWPCSRHDLREKPTHPEKPPSSDLYPL